jgi:ribokinase
MAIPPYIVRAVDTTGAGDAACGALAAALSQGADIATAARRATAAGALAATKHGAVPSLPTRDEIDALTGG